MTQIYTLAEIRNGTGFEHGAKFVLQNGSPDTSEPDAKYQALQDIGESTARNIAEMVAALECDYDRLEDLRGTVSDLDSVDYTKDEKTELAAELAELEEAAGECESRDDAERRIQESPLSVEVRSGWHTPGEPSDSAEFCILLSTGGPATRIIGELDNGEPTRARIQAQNWFTVWTDYTGSAISRDDLLTYCRCFYFGE
ncbi:MAG: hypothetical protein ACP5P4_05305 [Steroidobacteraceae bacterium]